MFSKITRRHAVEWKFTLTTGALSSGPVSSIQRAVADCFGNVGRVYGFAAFEIGDGATDFENSIVGAG